MPGGATAPASSTTHAREYGRNTGMARAEAIAMLRESDDA